MAEINEIYLCDRIHRAPLQRGTMLQCYLISRLCYLVSRLCYLVSRLCYLVSRLPCYLVSRLCYFIVSGVCYLVSRLCYLVSRPLTVKAPATYSNPPSPPHSHTYTFSGCRDAF